MNIRNVLNGSVIKTRTMRDEGVYVLKVLDNYWNRRTRLCWDTHNNTSVTLRTIDIAAVQVGDDPFNGPIWEPVELTKAQQRQLAQQRHLEYVTSPESETYWCS